MVIGEFTSTAASVGRTKAPAIVATSPGSFVAMNDAQIDAGWRVEMARKGSEEIARNPRFSAAAQQFATDADGLRGFAIAIGTLSSGRFSAAGMRATLNPGSQRGFDAGAAVFRGASSGLTQGPGAPSSADDGGIPRVAIIGGVALVVGAAAFFFLRKR